MAVQLLHNFSLTALNTFGVASSCDTYLRVSLDSDFPEALRLARAHAGPRGVFVLGGGSNLLLTEPHYAGCVLHVDTHGRRMLDEGVVEGMAGEHWHSFVVWTIEQGAFGLENLALIPGTVGASPVQNIGAYGIELSQVFHSCDVISRSTGEPRRLSAAECAFAYRDSIFKSFVGRDWIIRRVRLKLSPTPKLNLAYGDIRSELIAQKITAPSPADVCRAVMQIRTRKLPDPVLLGNAGSFFKNPVIPPAQFLLLRETYPHVPHYPDSDGWVKIPAAWLIEQCGFKGRTRGAAGVHTEHALVLVNHGEATGAEIWALAQDIMAAVDQKFAIPLSPEPVIL